MEIGLLARGFAGTVIVEHAQFNHSCWAFGIIMLILCILFGDGIIYGGRLSTGGI